MRLTFLNPPHSTNLLSLALPPTTAYTHTQPDSQQTQQQLKSANYCIIRQRLLNINEHSSRQCPPPPFLHSHSRMYHDTAITVPLPAVLSFRCELSVTQCSQTHTDRVSLRIMKKTINLQELRPCRLQELFLASCQGQSNNFTRVHNKRINPHTPILPTRLQPLTPGPHIRKLITDESNE